MSVVKISNRRGAPGAAAVLLVRERVVLSETSFAELVVWKLPRPVPGCMHLFKYRFAYVDGTRCLVRFDNESGKGDHVHVHGMEESRPFSTMDDLKRAFFRAVKEVRSEDSHP